MSKVVDFFLRRKRLSILLVVVFFVGVGISTLCRGGIGPPPRRTDLTVFLRAAEAIQSDENIYTVTNERCWHYVYLPLLAILLTPFTRLPLLVNTTLWYMLSVALFCGMIFLSTKLARDRFIGMRAAVMAVLFCMPSLLESMTRGQLGVLSIFLAIAILYLDTRGWAVWAGVLFGFSVVLKTSPLASLIVLFIARRKWKIVATGVLSILFFVWAYPSFAIGVNRNWLFLAELSRILTEAASNPGHRNLVWSELATPLVWDNQSLYAVLIRWTRPTDAALAAHGDLWVRWGVRIFGAVALCVLAFVSGRKKSQLSPKRLMLEYSLFLILMLLISPVSERHHYTMLFAMFLAVFLYLDELPRNSAFYQCLMWSSLIAGLTQILAYVRPFGVVGLPAIGALLFWGVSLVFLVNRPEFSLKPFPVSSIKR